MNYSTHCFGDTQSHEPRVGEKRGLKSKRHQAVHGALKIRVPGRGASCTGEYKEVQQLSQHMN